MIIFTLIMAAFTLAGLIITFIYASTRISSISNKVNRACLTLESHSKRLQVFESKLNVLKFTIENGANKTVISTTGRYLHYIFVGDDHILSYVYGEELIRLRIPDMFGNEFIVKKDTELEAIIKSDKTWIRLNKPKKTIYEIPEPAEFAEKTEATNTEVHEA